MTTVQMFILLACIYGASDKGELFILFMLMALGFHFIPMVM